MGNIISIFSTKPDGFRLAWAVGDIKASPQTIPRISNRRALLRRAGGHGCRERVGYRNTGAGRIAIAGSSPPSKVTRHLDTSL
jgi:hypothetical protein